MDIADTRLLIDKGLGHLRDRSPGRSRAEAGGRWGEGRRLSGRLPTEHHLPSRLRPSGLRPAARPSRAAARPSRHDPPPRRDIRSIARALAVQSAIDGLVGVGTRASVASGHSMFSVLSWRSAGSVASAWSVLAVGSLGSIGSSGSILSIGSAGSILSIGSSGSILSIGGRGSILGIGSRASDGAPDEQDDAVVRRLSRLMALGALAGAWHRPGRLPAA